MKKVQLVGRKVTVNIRRMICLRQHGIDLPLVYESFLFWEKTTQFSQLLIIHIYWAQDSLNNPLHVYSSYCVQRNVQR